LWALERDGWSILARRLRTKAGEIDIVAERNGLLAVVEVKARPTLSNAAEALSLRQQERLIAATEIILAMHPQWAWRAFDSICCSLTRLEWSVELLTPSAEMADVFVSTGPAVGAMAVR
jgi:Holliday junction resolvase-like predicted endonuclease